MTAIRTSAGWKAVHPIEGVRWLSALTVPWWVAGGWAIDLFAGGQSRPHKDLDIGILRRDALHVISALSSWEFFEAKRGELTRLHEGVVPRAEVNSLWRKPADTTQWVLELMLDDSDEDRWVFRRETKFSAHLLSRFGTHQTAFRISRPRSNFSIKLVRRERRTKPTLTSLLRDWKPMHAYGYKNL